MPVEIEKLEMFHQEVKKCCRKDKYNLFLNKHLGDVFYMVAMCREFETKYKKRLHYIVRPAHAFLMGMFGVKDYSTYDMSEFEKVASTGEYKYMVGAPNKSHSFDMMCKDIFPSVPQLGQPFVADADGCRFPEWDHYWSKRWAYSAGLNPDTLFFPLPRKEVELCDDIREKLGKEVTDALNQIVLLAPDASTAAEFPVEVWDALAERIHEKGYKIIVNSKRYKIKHGISAFELNLSLRDVVALGQRCAYVMAMRTGLCDVLVGMGKRLYAIYPAMLRREYGSLTRVFEEPTGANEILLYRWSVNPMKWEGEDLSPIFREWMDKQRRHCRVENRHGGVRVGRSIDVRAIADQANIFPDNNVECPLPRAGRSL